MMQECRRPSTAESHEMTYPSVNLEVSETENKKNREKWGGKQVFKQKRVIN